MEASFDNKTNLLNANIRSSVDNSIIYTITTSHNLRGRNVTILKDANPVFNASPTVGAIYWKKQLFEVHGHRKSISDIKSKHPLVTPTIQQQPQEKITGGGRRVEKETVVRKQSKKGGRMTSTAAAIPVTTTTTPRTTAAKRRKEVKEEQQEHNSNSNSVPQRTSWSSPLVRPSSALLGYIGLADWWRSVTCTARYWRWAADRSEFELSYQHEQWKVSLAVLDEDENDEKKGSRYDRRRVVSRQSNSDAKTISAHPSRDSRSRASSAGSSSSTPRTLQVDAFSYVASDLALDSQNAEEEEGNKCTPAAASLCIPYRNHLFHKTKPPVLHLGPAALRKDEVFMILALIYSETKRQDKTNTSGGW